MLNYQRVTIEIHLRYNTYWIVMSSWTIHEIFSLKQKSTTIKHYQWTINTAKNIWNECMIERPIAASERVTLAAHRAQQATRPPTIRRGGKHPFLYPLVSSNMAGWKIPELNGGSSWENHWFLCSTFQHAMFDYLRVWQITILYYENSLFWLGHVH